MYKHYVGNCYSNDLCVNLILIEVLLFAYDTSVNQTELD